VGQLPCPLRGQGKQSPFQGHPKAWPSGSGFLHGGVYKTAAVADGSLKEISPAVACHEQEGVPPFFLLFWFFKPGRCDIVEE